jgi:hypothetical protein
MDNLSGIVFIALAILVLLGVLVVFRLLFRIGDDLAILSLLLNGLRDVLGARGFVLGCALVAFICLGCLSATVLAVISLGTCATTNPSQFCHLLGR